MPIAPRIPQGPNEVVSLEGWLPDDEFPYGPIGAKAKRIFICPDRPPYGFLIGGHRYIFKEPQGTKAQQIWSEVIAYELARRIGVEVPPAFLATAPGNGSPGVLIEYFYGHRYDPEWRLVHGIERLQARGFETDLKRGSLVDNLNLCRAHKVPNAGGWWAETIIFDALIGNTDRHSENWGFLAERGANERPHFIMAPVFDNGTSLGYIIGEDRLAERSTPEGVARFIAKGHHHFGWTAGDKASGQHVELCRRFAREAKISVLMCDKLHISDSEIDALLADCVRTPFPIRFSEERALFVSRLLKMRRDALIEALGC
ncbi:hypothetical protein FKB34_12280 [Glycocaulis profundi]|nr:hypothetical protein FKB34_12280 [Glycocaulis profundi]